MSHPAALIGKIRSLIEADYPPFLFRYQIERPIPGTRMFPDILVFDALGKMVCAVEIGYTRPEKLTAYRQAHQIPDVRWYDKQGILHGDVTEKTVRLSIGLIPGGTFTVWLACDSAPCWDAGGCAPDPPDRDEEWDDYSEAAFYDVECYYVTNYAFAWMICHCAKCQRVWIGDRDNHDLLGVFFGLASDTPDELSKDYSEMARGSWDESCAYIQQTLGIQLKPEDGIPLHNELRSLMLKAVPCD